MALNPKEVADLKQTVKTLLDTWMRIKLAFQKAFGREQITKEQENAFLGLLNVFIFNELAHNPGYQLQETIWNYFMAL